jgi:hypothetical protein
MPAIFTTLEQRPSTSAGTIVEVGSSLRACEEIGVLFSKPSLRGAERRSNPGARGTPHGVRWIAPAFAHGR